MSQGSKRTTLREKTDEVRRSHILEAAAQVFAERGYHRATIKEVARAAGVSDGSIYNVFENKTALLLSLLDPLAAASNSAGPLPAEGDDASARLEGYIRQRWDAFSPATLQVLRSVLAEALVNDELRQLFFDRVLAPALDGGRVDAVTGMDGSAAGAEPGVALRPLVGAMMGLILLLLLGDEVTAQHWETFPGRLAQVFSPTSA
jgi:TetR/AcrR family transcriptional regulator, fatty acid metabolism regulator protein